MKRLVHLLIGSAFILVAFFQSVPSAGAQTAYIPQVRNNSWQYHVANNELSFCRLGINGHLGSYQIKPLRLGWYLDYSATSFSRPDVRLSYFPMLRLQQIGNNYSYALFLEGDAISAGQLQAVIASRPGAYWFIGNEPDRRKYQDDIEPEVYARAYNELYHLIQAQDPTAKVVAGTIVQPTPLRLEYLDKILTSYSQLYQAPMPVDVWAFHNFILNEEDDDSGAGIPPGSDATEGMRVGADDHGDVELFKAQVIRFRQWMADRGYRNTPAFLSEFGILVPSHSHPQFSVEVVNEFMNETFTFLLNTTDPNIGYPGDENRLVQRFAWYSMDYNTSHNGFLFDRFAAPGNSRSAMGDNFANFANALEERVDFFPTSGGVLSAPPLTDQGTTTITLETGIGSSGNLGVGVPAIVRFYNGDPNSGGVQIGSAQTLYLQGCGEQGSVQIEWANVVPGDYTVFVRVTTVAGLEVDQGDNQITFPVTIADN